MFHPVRKQTGSHELIPFSKNGEKHRVVTNLQTGKKVVKRQSFGNLIHMYFLLGAISKGPGQSCIVNMRSPPSPPSVAETVCTTSDLSVVEASTVISAENNGSQIIIYSWSSLSQMLIFQSVLISMSKLKEIISQTD